METRAAPAMDVHPGATAGVQDGEAARLVGRVRPFWMGLLLVVVTLGIYHFYWHWAVHREVAVQRGRVDGWASLWFLYVGAAVAIIFLSFALLLTLVQRGAVAPRGQLELLMWLGARVPGPVVGLLIVLTLASYGAFYGFLVRQHQWLAALSAEAGLDARANGSFAIALFLVADGLSFVWAGILDFVALVALLFAYAVLQSDYNEVWGRLAERGAGAMVAADGRVVREVAFDCSGCGAPNTAAAREGDEVITTCMVCGATQQVRVRRPPPASTDPSGVVCEAWVPCPACRQGVWVVGAPNEDVSVWCDRCGSERAVTVPSGV